jgi:membrane-bound serine protease (ClpP class)
MPEALRVVLFISLGFILLLIELFTPGFGLAGISGILLLTFGCYLAYIKLNLFWGILTSLVSLLAVIGFFKIFSHSFIWKKIRLENKQSKENGFSSGTDLSHFLNKTGLTQSALRPSGIAIIDGKRLDVTAESLFIEKDKKVKVIKVAGNKVIVKEED